MALQLLLPLELSWVYANQSVFFPASTLFMEGNLLRRTKKHQEAKSAYLRAQEAWLAGGRLRTHHFNGACMYKLGCISDDLGETEQAM